MRSASVIASSWSWVTKMNVRLSSWCSRSHSARSSRRSLASRLDSGSSSRKVEGLVTRVRASATRCDSPPEHWFGILPSRCAMRTISATSRTRRLRSSGGTRFMRRPNSMFCATVLCGNSAWVWNTMPSPRSRGSRSLTARPSMRISPADRILEAGDHAQRRGLAAARGTDQHDELAVLDCQVESFDGDHGPVGLAQPLELDPRHRYLRTMPNEKPRARCLRMIRPMIISGMVMPTASAACRP